MKVELLHIADCPNTGAARRLVEEALRELGLSEEILEVEVSDPETAERLCFPGSPTIRIDEIDVETPSSKQNSHGLACRTYLPGGRLPGVPPRQMMHEALLSAISNRDRRTKKS